MKEEIFKICVQGGQNVGSKEMSFVLLRGFVMYLLVPDELHTAFAGYVLRSLVIDKSIRE